MEADGNRVDIHHRLSVGSLKKKTSPNKFIQVHIHMGPWVGDRHESKNTKLQLHNLNLNRLIKPPKYRSPPSLALSGISPRPSEEEWGLFLC